MGNVGDLPKMFDEVMDWAVRTGDLRMSEAPKFCSRCGAVMKRELDGYFDENTGEPTTRLVCSVEPCEHGDHDLQLAQHTSVWRRFWYPSCRCARCGKLMDRYGLMG